MTGVQTCALPIYDTATTEIYTLSLHDALPIYTLKSASANLGAMALSAAAKRIELGARQGVLPRPAVAVAVLESEFRRAANAMNGLLKA